MTARRVDSQEKMAQVIKTARQLFVEHGYYNVSIPAIVKASGVSTGAIYNYFSSKENLAQAIHNYTLNEFQDRFDEGLQGQQTCRDKLKSFVDLIIEITEADPVMMEYMMFMKHGEFIRDSLPICYTEPFQRVREIIAQGMANDEIKNQEVFVATVSFTGIIHRAVELRLLGVIKRSLKEVAETFFNNAWDAIKTA